VEVIAIEQHEALLHLHTSVGDIVSENLVITAGWGTNELLQRVDGCSLQFPLIPDRPSQSKYFIPPPEKRHMFTADALPVFAYLDVGIYGHPIYEDKTLMQLALQGETVYDIARFSPGRFAAHIKQGGHRIC
jgi:hypothetical protein